MSNERFASEHQLQPAPENAADIASVESQAEVIEIDFGKRMIPELTQEQQLAHADRLREIIAAEEERVRSGTRPQRYL